MFNVIAILVTLAALFSYLNHRFVKLPNTIGLMLISLVMSLGLVALGQAGLAGQWVEFVRGIDFNRTLMVGMLSFLLFAGALHVDVNDLLEQKWRIGFFATLGVALSTFLVGTIMYFILTWAGHGMGYIYCLLFGAVISPTDPIAVLGILRKARAPKSLEIKMSGESLFNDGVGVVVFIVLLGIALGEREPSFSGVALLFVEEAVGGFGFGLLLGWAAYSVLKSVDDYQVEILATLALVTGGYALALAIHTSGPIAIVVAGLLIGNHGRKFAMSEKTRKRLDMFWGLLDEVLNSVLFVLIGLELLAVTLTGRYVLLGAAAIPVALLARFISIGLPVCFLRHWREFSPGAIKALTWGGLRGGISVALALALPEGPERDLVLTMTYIVVVFSILVQGLTIKYLVRPHVV
jgi:CPA1 family monovalent cation:H+ antiporter